MKPVTKKLCPYCNLKGKLEEVEYQNTFALDGRAINIYECPSCKKTCKEAV